MHSTSLIVSLVASPARNGPIKLSYPEVFPELIDYMIGSHIWTISWNVPNFICSKLDEAICRTSHVFLSHYVYTWMSASANRLWLHRCINFITESWLSRPEVTAKST